MGDVIVVASKVLGALSVLCLIAGFGLNSRPLKVLGASIAVSLVLTWVLGLLGLPVGIFFGFLSFGGLFSGRSKRGGDAPH